MSNNINPKEVVPARCWDYLIDFVKNDKDNYLKILYNVDALEELSVKSFWNFFYVITTSDRQLGQR